MDYSFVKGNGNEILITKRFHLEKTYNNYEKVFFLNQIKGIQKS